LRWGEEERSDKGGEKMTTAAPVGADPVGLTVAAILTIFVYTYFISNKQVPTFRFAQSTVVGGALGYIVVIVMATNIDKLAITKLSQGRIDYIIPIVLGLLIYSRYVKGYEYLARTPIALIVATGLGLGARAAMDTQIIRLLYPFASMNFKTAYDAFNSVVFLVGFVASVAFFFFTLNPKVTKTITPLTKLGRYFLMVYFGTKFGATILTRATLFLGRLQFLLFEWLGLG
jgi:lipoprotein signal peptidase